MNMPFLFKSRGLGNTTRSRPAVLLNFKSYHFFHRSTLQVRH